MQDGDIIHFQFSTFQLGLSNPNSEAVPNPLAQMLGIRSDCAEPCLGAAKTAIQSLRLFTTALLKSQGEVSGLSLLNYWMYSFEN